MRGRVRLSLVTVLMCTVLTLPRPASAEGEPSYNSPVLATQVAAVAEPAAARTVAVTVQIQVANRSQEQSRNLMVVIPPMVHNRAGTQKVLAVEWLTEPERTRELAAGVEATYWYPQVNPGATFVIEQRYTVELNEKAEPILEELNEAQFTTPTPGVEADNPAIQAKAETVTAGLTAVDDKAEAIMQFVVDHLSYDLNSPSRNRGALAAFQSGSGVCTEYAGLFVAMARASGIPARMVYGWASGNLTGQLNATNRHAWAEYYSAERGWIAVDPTFAEALPANQLMAFDGLNHIAQDYRQTNLSSSYAGRGSLSITHSTWVGSNAVAVNNGR